MTQIQYLKLLADKGLESCGDAGYVRTKDFVILLDNDGAAIIKGKIMASVVDKIIDQLPETSPFIKDYESINAFLSSDSLEAKKKVWLKELGVEGYCDKLFHEWEAIVKEEPREELWIIFNILRCEDADSFAAALNVLL